jgi:hypothetical protein
MTLSPNIVAEMVAFVAAVGCCLLVVWFIWVNEATFAYKVKELTLYHFEIRYDAWGTLCSGHQ